jgi:hypothetical protein
VLSLLNVQDLIKLYSAYLRKEGRKVLSRCFRFVTVRPAMRNLRDCNIATFLQWLVDRGIRLTDFRKKIPGGVSPADVDSWLS